MIGIIVAMDKELELLLPMVDDVREFVDGRFRFYCGGIGQREIVVMKSGIGKVNAALAAQAMIDPFQTRIYSEQRRGRRSRWPCRNS